MSDNFTYSDANDVSRIIRATEQSSVYTPHHIAASLVSGVPTPVSESDQMPVTLAQASLSSFGEVMTAILTPFVQASGIYNILPANMRTFTASGGSATVSSGEFVCQTGTTIYGYGVTRSARSVNFKAGMGARFRGSARFSAGVANGQQGVGFFNVGDGLLFGYNGATFGIIHQHHGLQEVRTVAVTVASSGSTNLTLTLNSVAYTIPLTAGTTAHNAFEIEQWIKANASSAWTATQNGSNVILSASSDGAKSGTYSYSHATSTGTITQNTAGVTKTTDFVAQSSWNVDTCSWLDTTKENDYQIDLDGVLNFYIKNPTNGKYILVHRIQWTNNYTQSPLGNSSMRIGLYAASLGSTTNLITYASSLSCFIQGEPQRTRNPRSTSNNKTVSTTQTALFSLRNRAIFGNRANQIEIEPLLLTFFTESTKGAKITVTANSTLGGETNYSYLNESTLVSEVSTSETTVTSGTPLLEFQIAGNSNGMIDLTPLRIRVPPEIYITISASVNSGASAACGAALTWYEDL